MNLTGGGGVFREGRFCMKCEKIVFVHGPLEENQVEFKHLWRICQHIELEVSQLVKLSIIFLVKIKSLLLYIV